MKVIHFLEGRPKPESTNGVVKAVYFLTGNERKKINVEIWCTSRNINKFTITNLDNGIKCVILPQKEKFIPYAQRLIKKACEEEKNGLVFHLHGVFNLHNYLLAFLLVRYNIPYIISPHGSLHKYAFGPLFTSKFFKKIIFFPLLHTYLLFSSGVRFISETEKENSIILLSRSKSFIAPNGVSPLNCAVNCDKKTFNLKKITFLGRIDPYHKGIDLIMDSILYIKTQKKFSIHISGPVEDERFLSQLHSTSSPVIKVKPFPVLGEEKRKLLSSTFFFIHPSRYEVGFPLSIMEALACGIPVITTTRVDPARIIEKSGAGFVVAPVAGAIAEAIEKALDLPYYNWCKMSENSSRLSQKFTWESAAEGTIKFYMKIADGKNSC